MNLILLVMLNQSNRKIVGPIAWLLGKCITALYNFFSMFGIENAALCIFVFTFIMRALMIPIYYRQQKTTLLMSRMNPELQAIQEKYKGKNDTASQQKMAMETQELYQKYGSNPMSGCLPLLITFPIMIALYEVIQNIPAYIPAIKNIYLQAADAIHGQSGYVDTLNGLITGNTAKLVSGADVNSIIDVISKFTKAQWQNLASAFPSASDTITAAGAQIAKVNNVFGICQITDTPKFTNITIIIPLIAAFTQWLATKLSMANQPQTAGNDQAAAMNKSMNIFMPIMTGFFCFTFPVGIGIYWIAGNLFMLIQQLIFNKMLKKVDVDELIKKNQEKAAKKRAKRKDIPTTEAFNRYANVSTKSIATMDTENLEQTKKSSGNYKKGVTKKVKDYKITDYYRKEGEYHTTDIAAVANMLKKDDE